MRRTSGTTTVVRAYGVLAGILDDAVKSRRLAVNPGRGVENLPDKAGKRRVYLTVDDVARLAAESGPHRALVLTLAYTGVRWGEAVALRVRDVQFLRRRLSVHDNAVQIGAKHLVGQTKGRQERSVPVPQFVLDELAVQCERRAAWTTSYSATGPHTYSPKSSTGWFQAAVKRAKVQKITPHDLRHSCASISISLGVNVLALSRMLGHKSAKITLDTYADLFDTDLDAVAETLDSKCAQSVPKVCPAAAVEA
jgi:integrase